MATAVRALCRASFLLIALMLSLLPAQAGGDAEHLTIATGDIPAASLPAKPEPCFPVDRVQIAGIALVESSEISEAVRPFAGRCQGNTLVKGLMLAINGVYAKHGYVTTQAYLPKQDLKRSRLLAVEIKVGRIADVRYDETPAWSEGGYLDRLGKRLHDVFSANDLASFFGSLDALAEAIDDPLERPLISTPAARVVGANVVEPGHPLQLETLQQGLDNLNRAASSKAQAKLEPGADPGSSLVVIKNPQNDSFRVVAGYDTYGTKATGIDRSRLEIARDNLIGVNDTWKASLTSSVNANEMTANFAVPLWWFTLTVDAKYSEIQIPLDVETELFTQNANITVAGVYTIERTTMHRTDVSLGLRLSGNNRWINDIELTPQRFVAAQVGVTRSWTFGKTALLSLSATASQGLDQWFATQDLADADATTPRAQFRKLESTANLSWAPLDGVTLTSTVQAQWSNSPLYAVEQLTLGTLSTIRGFRDAPFSVDRGGHWRNELATHLPVDWMLQALGRNGDPWLNSRLKGIEGYVFLDAGYGEDIANRRNDMLVGTGAGLRYRDSRITADWSVARGVYEKAKPAPESTEFYLNVGVKLF